MKHFLFKLIVFLIPFLVLLFSSIFIPPTPRVTKSYIFGKIKKDSLLKNVPPPRIIFIGGSNLSFGINSKMIKDSLGLNPINTGIAGNLGLIYMLDNTLPYIQSGDIVIVSPEYDHFFYRYAYGSEELLRTVLDVSHDEWRVLRKEQYVNIFPYFIKYAVSKIIPSEYFNVKEDELYGVNSFNEYGDVNKHWKMEKPSLPFSTGISGKFNYSIVDELWKFRDKVVQKNAIVFINYPGIQSSSYENSKTQIMQVASELKKKGFSILGSPERYMIPESLVFDTAYHLTENGANYRTKLFIEDLKAAMHALSTGGKELQKNQSLNGN